MRPIRRPTSRAVPGALVLASIVLVGACSSAGASSSPAASGGVAGASATAASSAPASGGSGGGRYGSEQASASTAASVMVQVGKAGSVGSVLTGAGGKTLYVFKKDGPSRSACTGGCASTWPPLTVSSASAVTPGSGVTGSLGTFTRDDGSLQVTWNGSPLYYFHNDQKAGDANGQGIGGLWFAATPQGAPAASASAAGGSSSGSAGGYGY